MKRSGVHGKINRFKLMEDYSLFTLLIISHIVTNYNRRLIKMDNNKSDLQFLNTKDIATLMGVSLPVARQIMYRKDFPLIKAGKNLKVMRKKFEEWASERRM